MTMFGEYLSSIGINKVERTLIAAERLCPEKMEEIFISDWIPAEGQRGYENLYFLTGTYIVESANFSTDTNINLEITVLKDRVKYILAKYNDYFEKASAESKLSITFYTNGGSFAMKATKENCDNLVEVYEKYIKSNISKTPIPE